MGNDALSIIKILRHDSDEILRVSTVTWKNTMNLAADKINYQEKRISQLEIAIEDIHKIIVGEEGKIEAVWEVFDKVQQLCEQVLTSLREDI